MNRNISLASRDPLPLGREDIYKGMEEIGAYLDVTPARFPRNLRPCLQR